MKLFAIRLGQHAYHRFDNRQSNIFRTSAQRSWRGEVDSESVTPTQYEVGCSIEALVTGSACERAPERHLVMNIDTRTQISEALGKNSNAHAVATQIGEVSHVSVWQQKGNPELRQTCARESSRRFVEATRQPKTHRVATRQHKSRNCLEDI